VIFLDGLETGKWMKLFVMDTAGLSVWSAGRAAKQPADLSKGRRS